MNTFLLISYIIFIWFVLLHTLEEIACDIMETQIGHIQMTRNKYLLGVAAIFYLESVHPDSFDPKSTDWYLHGIILYCHFWHISGAGSYHWLFQRAS